MAISSSFILACVLTNIVKPESSNSYAMESHFLLLGILLFSLIGTFLGVFTGLTPGIHVNIVAATFIALQASLMAFVSFLIGWANPTVEDILLLLSCMIFANAVSHTFLDYIPSVFLGVPDSDTALSVLPGHRMLLAGKGYEAVLLSAFGSLTALMVFLSLMFPARLVMGGPFHLYEKMSWSIPFILVTVVVLLIVGEPPRPQSCRPVLHCSEHGLLGDESEYHWVRRILGKDATSYDLWTAGAFSGRVLKANDSSVTIETREHRIVVEFEAHRDVSPGDRIFVAGVAEPSRSVACSLRTKCWALIVFTLSGLLGHVVLSGRIFVGNWYPFPSLITDVESVGLFPLFTGLFGLSTLILSVSRTSGIPPQDINIEEREIRMDCLSSALKGSLAGSWAGWFPGISNATATVIAKMLDRRGSKADSEKEFIVAVSAVNTSSCFFTLLALFVLGRARSGVMNAIMEGLTGTLVAWDEVGFPPVEIAGLLFAGLVAASSGYVLTKAIGRRVAKVCERVNYRRLVLTIIGLLVIMIVLLSGMVGLVVALIAITLGLVPPVVGVKRVHLMGCLILPLMLFFWG